MKLQEFAEIYNQYGSIEQVRTALPALSNKHFGQMLATATYRGLLHSPPTLKPSRNRNPKPNGRPRKSVAQNGATETYLPEVVAHDAETPNIPSSPYYIPPVEKNVTTNPTDCFNDWLCGVFAAIGTLDVTQTSTGEIQVVARIGTVRKVLADAFYGRYGGSRSGDEGAYMVRLNQDDDGLFRLAQDLQKYPVHGELAAKIYPWLESAFWYRENTLQLKLEIPRTGK